MFNNHLKIAWRNLARRKGYTLINVAGLATGIACGILILLFVQDELSYDRHFANAARIFRLAADVKTAEGTVESAAAPTSWGPAVMQTFPEAENMTRMQPLTRVMTYKEKSFTEKILCVDTTFFEVFSFELLKGDRATALKGHFNQVVISERLAEKMFGDEDPLGEMVEFEDQVREFMVTGVMPNLPEKTHFQAEAVRPFNLWMYDEHLPNWTNAFVASVRVAVNQPIYTYLLLKDAKDASPLAEKLRSLLRERLPAEWQERLTPVMQPLTGIHLHSQRFNEIFPGGDIRYVYLFSALAVILLLIAGVNFTNLAVARAAERAKEVGMRKTLGALRAQLIGQFLGEATLQSAGAMLLALVLVELALPGFNALSGKAIALSYSNAWILPGILAGTIAIGVVAGAYPAFHLSRFLPVAVLRGGRIAAGSASSRRAGGETLRRLLVVFQFATAIVLIIGAAVVYQQLGFLQNKKLGFDKELMVVVPCEYVNLKRNRERFKAELLRRADIVSIATASLFPGDRPVFRQIRRADAPENAPMLAAMVWADHDYAATLGLEMAAGRWFSDKLASDSSAFVINETAARQLGYNSADAALDRELSRVALQPDGAMAVVQRGPIIGVVRDFHFTSLHETIKPQAFSVPPKLWEADWIAVKIRPGDIPATLAAIERTWKSYTPDYPYSFSFLDQDLDALYRTEQRAGTVMGVFAGLAILIACLGLLGLTAYVAAQRTKEIGIRKVLGASVANIVTLLGKDLLRLVVVALVVAMPIAWFAMNRWLQDFAYRIEISWWMFALAGGLALVIALLTVSTQAIKAALANPVEALRYE
jgi:putative ABC transport system permease protein